MFADPTVWRSSLLALRQIVSSELQKNSSRLAGFIQPLGAIEDVN
jgi:hypothetical protein